MPLIEETFELIKVLHGDTLDKCGLPYWMHPVEVMKNLHPDANEEDRIIALLHDTAEDCFDKNIMKAISSYKQHGYSEYVISGVLLLTRMDGKIIPYSNLPSNIEFVGGSYKQFISNIIASGHFGAIITKLSDNKHNSNPARIKTIVEDADRESMISMSKNRYSKSILRLEEELTHWRNRKREH